MNLNHLYYFRTVARLQHFTRAAEELSISQPSLSYAISTLEKELDTVLFEKKGRNVKLTKYGKLFLEYIERGMDEIEAGQKMLRKLSDSEAGRIDIGYVYPLAPRYIPRMVRCFLDIPQNQEVSFTFYQGITAELVSGLKSQKYDVIFSSLEDKEDEIEFQPILEHDLVAVVPGDHPLAGAESLTLLELSLFPLVCYNRETGLGQLTHSLFREAGITPHIISEAENEHALYGLVSEKFGVSLIADTPDKYQYDVKTIPIKDHACKRSIYIGYLKNQFLSASAKRFIDYACSAEFPI